MSGQNSGGFIQNQDFCSAHKGFENFHFLFHAHRDIHYFRVWINPQIISVGILFGDLDSFFVVYKQTRLGRRHAQNDVLGDCQAGHQHKVLMDHADAKRDGFVGRSD